MASSAGIFDTTLKPLRADGGEVINIAVISRIVGPPASAPLSAMRAGYESIEEYGKDINCQPTDCCTDPARNMSAQATAEIGSRQESVRRLPNARGALCFADLDARIRAESRGKRKLDDWVFPMFKRRAKGHRFDHAARIALVTGKLGRQAKQQFESVILNGAILLPVSNAFGQCFRCGPKAYHAAGKTIERFEWGRVPAVPVARCRQR